jgi:hypothetical protein
VFTHASNPRILLQPEAFGLSQPLYRLHERGEQLPALEHFYVVCPAVVDDKARPGFESWWQEATTDDVLF